MVRAVFSRNVVLNITRKQREWRFYEFIGLRVEDLPKITAVVSDIRKIIKQARQGSGARRRGLGELECVARCGCRDV